MKEAVRLTPIICDGKIWKKIAQNTASQALIKDSDSEFWIAHREKQELFQITC